VSKKTSHLALSALAVGVSASLAAACFSDATPASTGGATTATGGDGGSTGSGGTIGGGTTGGGNPGTGGTTGGGDAGGAALDVIDDMEGATGSILTKEGRVGAWYTYNDATAGATETPGVPFLPSVITPPRGASTYAARMQGAGFTTWGAGMGLNFNDPGDGAGGSAKAPPARSASTSRRRTPTRRAARAPPPRSAATTSARAST
jgi:hypothetical protein